MNAENVATSLKDWMQNPLTTWAAAATTEITAFLIRAVDNLPIFHQILSDIAAVCGIIACISLIRVHIRREKQIKVQIEYDELRKEEIRIRISEHKSKDKL